MKFDWKKEEKHIYKPKQAPTLVEVPKYKFFTLTGTGNPNSPEFAEYIGALYAVSYAVKMSYKKEYIPDGYFEYAVYPLEGVWDLIDPSKQVEGKPIDKDNLKFELMMRQPDFVTDEFAQQMIELSLMKKKIELIGDIQFKSIEEGPCVQMLHVGPYDTEPESFKLMEAYCMENGLKRVTKVHREIYLSDARKTAPEKLKTILRFRIEKIKE